jgi:hypothetical protein
MGGYELVRVVLVALLVAIAACGDDETTTSTDPPPPATEAEIEAFCESYEAVRNQSWGELTVALVKVSPAEIKAEMIEGAVFYHETDALQRSAFRESCLL